MEGNNNNEMFKLSSKTNSTSVTGSSASTTDTGGTGLTFGPAWLRQLSSGDTAKVALPPSPGLAFQLAKHRYGREEMLGIYESIEKSLYNHSTAPFSYTDFEDLYKKDVQRPISLSQPTPEEQKYLSTCVNSQLVLNLYNKIQGNSNRDRESNTNSSNNPSGSNAAPNNSNSATTNSSSRGGANSSRGGRGFPSTERGGGAFRGRGRGRGGDFKPPLDDESTRGGGKFSKGSYGRSHNWEERYII